MLPRPRIGPPAAPAAPDAPVAGAVSAESDAPTGPVPRPRPRRLLLAGAVALAGLLTAAVFGVALRGRPPLPGPPPPSPAATGPALELAEPSDLGDHVVLSWTGGDGLDFVVVVVGDGEPSRYLIAQRNRTMRVSVEPGRKYCFQVRATDSDRVYLSQPRGVRGAVCPTSPRTGPADQGG